MSNVWADGAAETFKRFVGQIGIAHCGQIDIAEEMIGVRPLL